MSFRPPTVPITELLEALGSPAALLSGRGAISWVNPAFEALFRPGSVPASLAEWEQRSPPGGGGLWEELRRRRAATRELAFGRGVALLHLSLVPCGPEEGVLQCSSPPASRGIVDLRDRTAPLEALFHCLGEGVLALDREGRIAAFSASAERMTGLAEAEVLGRSCREVFQAAPDDECPFEAAIRDRRGFHRREMQLRGRGSRPLYVWANATPVREPGGACEGAVVVLRDLGGPGGAFEGLPQSGARALVGRHPSMVELADLIEAVSPSEVPVLVRGERGTGKKLVAAVVHELSGRRGPFVRTSCGALPDALLEAELFGGPAGAGSGAFPARIGRLEAARGGTLFLDEIGEASPRVQEELARVLEQGWFRPPGAAERRLLEARIVASTKRDLAAEVAEGRFRADLHDRFAAARLTVPALRDRQGDVPLLADHFLKRLALAEGRRKVLVPSAHDVLQGYPWPGNVWELESALAHAYVRSTSDAITPEALPEYLRGQPAAPDAEDAEREAEDVYSALVASGWNKGEAAKKLGLSRTTLWRRMRDLGIRDRRRAALRVVKS